MTDQPEQVYSAPRKEAVPGHLLNTLRDLTEDRTCADCGHTVLATSAVIEQMQAMAERCGRKFIVACNVCVTSKECDFAVALHDEDLTKAIRKDVVERN